MSAIFTIDQATLPPGVPDRSRDDIIPAGAPVQFAAVLPHTTYAWDFLSQPNGITLAFSDPSLPNPTVDFGSAYGGYLVRLTVDVGLATEDVSVRYVGLQWPVSSKAMPALSETNQDNSQTPFTGYRGWEEKIMDYLWWVEQNIGASSGAVTPHHYVYVDEYNGDDTLGTGEISSPYKTFQHAATTVPDPTDTTDFYFPIHFVLNPGTYPGKVILPGKRAVYIIEAPGIAVIDADVDWNIDPDWWALYGSPAANWASLIMIGPMAADRASDRPPALWHRGTLAVRNSNPGSANPMPYGKILHARGITWTDGGIWNQKSGTATPDAATGPLTIYADHCTVDGSAAGQGVFGERETITGTDFLPNFITLFADNCDIDAMYGSIRLGTIRNSTVQLIDHRKDWNGVPISGLVEGRSPGFQKSRIRTLYAGHDGADPMAPLAKSLWFDSFTWDELISGTHVFTNMDSDSPGSRGYNFNENDRGIDVDSSGFVNNLGPPGTLTILDEVLARIDSFVLGASMPTGLGRIYVDTLNGIDVPGNGTIDKPFLTLQYACASIPPTVLLSEFVTPVEFIMAPGMDASAGTIVLPPRAHVSITGRDVQIQNLIHWAIDPDWWSNCGTTPATYRPQLYIDGREVGVRAPSAAILQPATWFRTPLLLAGGLLAENINPGGGAGAWQGGHRVYLDGVACPAITNGASGGAGPSPDEATGRMFLEVNKSYIGGLEPPLPFPGIIGSIREPLIPDELNIIYIKARHSSIGSVLSSAIFQEVEDCKFDAIHRLLDPVGTPTTYGYIGCGFSPGSNRPVFRDCEFDSGPTPYIFGWDGATGPGAPENPSFDKISYRSLLEMEKASIPVTIDTGNTGAVVDEAPSRIQVMATDIGSPGRELVSNGHLSPATAYPILWSSTTPPSLIKDGDFVHPGGGSGAKIEIQRNGRYRAEFEISWQNNQILWDNTVATGAWINGVQIPFNDVHTVMQAGAPGAPSFGTSVLTGFDGPLSAGDLLEIRAWLASTAYGPAPVYLLRIGTYGWLERVE
jgi:hypothetical protein